MNQPEIDTKSVTRVGRIAVISGVFVLVFVLLPLLFPGSLLAFLALGIVASPVVVVVCLIFIFSATQYIRLKATGSQRWLLVKRLYVGLIILCILFSIFVLAQEHSKNNAYLNERCVEMEDRMATETDERILNRLKNNHRDLCD